MCKVARFPKNEDFQDGKMPENEKRLSKKLLLNFLRQLGNGFPPARFRVVKTLRRAGQSGQSDAAMAEVTWNSARFEFAVEPQLSFNPKAIQDATQRATAVAVQLNANPLVLTPYLADEQLRFLEARQVSGIDLCGNGVIVVPDRLLIYRTGNPNKYPSSSPIRNVYRGTSSLIARAFLLKAEYATSQELLEEVRTRGGSATLSTVSKVCTSLADDLIIERQRQGRTTQLRLLQPEKLLDALATNFQAPIVRQQFTAKWAADEMALEDLLQNWRRDTGERVIRTGTSSSDRYATMAREAVTRYYCTDLTSVLQCLGASARETDRFPDFQLLETDDPTVCFDMRDDIIASPLQSYLELNAGDKRERETAEQIRQRLLEDVERLRRMP
jgi:hypothetical protein